MQGIAMADIPSDLQDLNFDLDKFFDSIDAASTSGPGSPPPSCDQFVSAPGTSSVGVNQMQPVPTPASAGPQVSLADMQAASIAAMQAVGQVYAQLPCPPSTAGATQAFPAAPAPSTAPSAGPSTAGPIPVASQQTVRRRIATRSTSRSCAIFARII